MKEKLTEMFGTDAAMGVTMMLVDTDEVLTAAQWDATYGHLPKSEMPETQSFLPNGGSAVCCTDYAFMVRERLPDANVVVVGFANEDNPTSRVARDEIHPGGHDFAIVNDRYLVDPWLTLVAAEDSQMVFDFQDAQDVAKVRDIYGPAICWDVLDTGLPYVDAGNIGQLTALVQAETPAEQADLDAFMLEHCPDAMSAEQFVNWAAHQRAA